MLECCEGRRASVDGRTDRCRTSIDGRSTMTAEADTNAPEFLGACSSSSETELAELAQRSNGETCRRSWSLLVSSEELVTLVTLATEGFFWGKAIVTGTVDL